ncbi:tyrosine-protein phosphatase non-receptor type 23 [Erpetoichthys calabaricus]|uniref:tyrosine-protein phosphatase non-receptor type 23 n=1 Tax=Erpetoichthys calabaricus TaxID=27687 RepID=UPI0022344AB4|nr:tyrosine-protein phosphatase non-receptor type 23 [Erpetoichthys calabaricus]
MEAVPRMPMIWLDLKEAGDFQFTSPVKQFILKHYGENPDNYNEQLKKLEQLRQAAVNVTRDFEGCSTLRKYFGQLHYLQSRVPLNSGQEAAVPITWTEIFSGKPVTHDDIGYEQACILYNLGALHSMLGAMDNRVSEEGMKVSCTHFQCSAGAFSYLRDHFRHDYSVDMSHLILSLNINLMLGQAQECLLEKSMLDNRKSFLVARISAQVVDYYKEACRALENSETASLLGKIQKDWKKLVQIKIYYFAAIAHLHMGKQAEEQQKFGERVAYLQSALDKLNEAVKLAKGQPDSVQEALRFTMDVIGGKFNSAKKDNDFIYHETVPALDTLPSVKGAPLVKALPVNPTDPSVTGPDIFCKLVPMAAHEASSLYSEEKAKLLRDTMAKIESKNETLEQFLDSLQLDSETVDNLDMYNHIPPILMEKCAALSVQPDMVKSLIQSMQVLSGVFTDVEASLNEIKGLLDEEQAEELRLEEVMGKQGVTVAPAALAEIRKDLDKYMEVHEKASFTNTELHRAMNLHITNLRLLGGPLDNLRTALPKPDLSEEDAAILQTMKRILGKVQEMKEQRISLEKQLRDTIQKDDITSSLVTTERSEMKKLFEEQLKKYEQVKVYIDQNLAAQENILKALTEANAQYASVRKALAETEHKWNTTVQTLVASYEAYEDLIKKSQEGKDFYDDLEGKASRLLERARSVCHARKEEIQQTIERELQKKPPPRPTAPKPPLQKKTSELDVGLGLEDPELQKLNAAMLALGSDLPEDLRSLPPDSALTFPFGQPAIPDAFLPRSATIPPIQLPGGVSFNQLHFPERVLPTDTLSRLPQFTATAGLPSHPSIPQQSNSGYLPPAPTLVQGPRPAPHPVTAQVPASSPQHSVVVGYGMGAQRVPAQSSSSMQLPSASHSAVPQLPQVPMGTAGVRPSTTTVDSVQTPISSFTPGSQGAGPGQPVVQGIVGINQARHMMPVSGGYSVPTVGQYPSYPQTAGHAQHFPHLPPHFSSQQVQPQFQLPHQPSGQQYQQFLPQQITRLPSQQQVFPAHPPAQMQPSPRPYLPAQALVPPNSQPRLQTTLGVQPQMLPTASQPHLPLAPTSQSYISSNIQHHIPPISSQPHLPTPISQSHVPSNMQPHIPHSGQSHLPTITSQPFLPPTGVPPRPLSPAVPQPHLHPQVPQPVPSQVGGTGYPASAPSSVLPHQGPQPVPLQQPQLTQPLHPQPVQCLPPSSSAATTGITMPYHPASLPHQSSLLAPVNVLPPCSVSSGMPPVHQHPSPNVITPSPAPSSSPGPSSLGLVPQRPPPSLTPSGSASSSSSDILFQRQNSTTEDLLSSSPESQHGGPKASAAVLLPTKADPQDGQRRRKSEGMRLIEGDPYQAPERLQRLQTELEALRNTMAALDRPLLGPGGPTELDTCWKELQDQQEKDVRQLSIAIARCYSMKNRHQDIMPYDFNRVVLQSGKDDYINASSIEELSPYCPRFIATQAPLSGTAADFWLMIYEQKVSLIVMLVSEQELEKQKVVRYFPCERGQQMVQGPITLTLTTHKVAPTHVERMIGLQYRDQSLKRTIIHLQFTSWPELGLPDSKSNLIRFIQEVHGHYLHQRPLHTPVVVHCSSGVGRTGAFCLLYAAMQEVEAGNSIPDLLLLVRKMRQQRKNMLQEKLHLKFCYEAVLKHTELLLQRHGISTSASCKNTNSTSLKSYCRLESQDIVLGGDMPISSIQATIAKLSIKPSTTSGPCFDSGHMQVTMHMGQNGVNGPDLVPVEAPLPVQPEVGLSTCTENSDHPLTSTTPPATLLEGGSSVSPPPPSSDDGKNGSTPAVVPEAAISAADSLRVSSSSLDLLASLTPEAFTLDSASKGKQRINKHSFLQPSSGQGLLGPPSGDDPLSSLDPLWTLNKT